MAEVQSTQKSPDKAKKTRLTAAEKRIAKRKADCYPLEEFSESHQAMIAEQVAAPRPPSRWRGVGGSDPRPLAWIESRGWYEWHWARGIDPEGRRAPIPRTLRSAVIARDGYVCQLCGGEIEPSDLHLDHIKPWSLGGRDTLSNLQASHSTCNMRKGARYGED